MEEFRDVEGYEGKYIVSSHGRVAVILRPGMAAKYGRYTLCTGRRGKKGKTPRKRYGAHQLVANAFLGKPNPEQTEINHLDGNKLNNHVDNLERCTRSENAKHAYRAGLKKIHNKTSDYLEDKIIEYYLTGKSQEATGNHCGMAQTTVSGILRRRNII